MAPSFHRSPRLGLAIAVILLVVAAGAWTLAWRHFADRIGAEMDAQAQALRQRGYAVTWASRTVGGYPFRYLVTMTDIVVAEPTGWGFATRHLEAEAAAYNPRVVVLVAPQFRLSRPGKPVIYVGGEALRMSIGVLPSRLPRVSMEGVGVTLRTDDDAPPTVLAGVERFEAHFQPRGDLARLFLRLDNAEPTQGSMLATLAGGKPVTLAIEGEINHAAALQGRGWAGLLGAWSAAGGEMKVISGGVDAGPALVSTKDGTLSADANGRLKGRLSVALQSAPQALLALGAVGVLPEETAAVATGLASFKGAGDKGIDLTFDFREGQTWLGPVPIGRAPRLY